MSETFVESPDVQLGDSLATETLPDLSDFADEPGGALQPGWYKAVIIEGYATRKGKQLTTEDVTSKDGASRNLRIAFQVSPLRGDSRNLINGFNYRPADFTPERLAWIKEKRAEYAGVQGKWADADAQRSSLAVAKLGQFQAALGFRFATTPSGSIVIGPLVGKELDVHVRIDKNGYNEVNEYAPAGTRTPKAAPAKS